MDRAPVVDPGGEQGLKLLARVGVEVADELAMSVTPREGAAGQGEPLDQERGRNDDALELQAVDDGAHDRLAPLGSSRGRGGGPVIGLPDGAQLEMGDDLARVLATGLVAAGVEVEQARLDPELIGDDLDDRGGQSLVDAQRAPEVMDKGELHRKAKPVVLPPMPPRQHDVLWRERIAALHRFVIGRRVEQGSAQLQREDRGGDMRDTSERGRSVP